MFLDGSIHLKPSQCNLWLASHWMIPPQMYFMDGSPRTFSKYRQARSKQMFSFHERCPADMFCKGVPYHPSQNQNKPYALPSLPACCVNDLKSLSINLPPSSAERSKQKHNEDPCRLHNRFMYLGPRRPCLQSREVEACGGGSSTAS